MSDLQIFKSKTYILLYFTVLSLILVGSLDSIIRLCHVKYGRQIEAIKNNRFDDNNSDTNDNLPLSKLQQPKAKGWHRPLPVILIKSIPKL